VTKAEKLLGVSNLYDPSNMDMLHCVESALKAHTLYKRDHHYVVQEGEVIIVDDFTGRLMHGRRWSDGLHQAVEAKEGVKIERENQTLATITLQNYFRMYEKLSGMTGTAETEAEEFNTVYGLDVVMIPTNRSMIRKDNSDMIYRTLPEKWDAVVDEIKELHGRGQPVLVGTVSVENSELIADRLKKAEFRTTFLTRKYHEREAEIVAQAGRKEPLRSQRTWPAAEPIFCSAAIRNSSHAKTSKSRRSIPTKRRRNSLRKSFDGQKLSSRPSITK
jgi:preprotein translocase subunit SecA